MKIIMRYIISLLAMMLLSTQVSISVSAESSCESQAHNWTAANCIAPKTCQVCGSTEGEANPYAHSIINGVCEYCGESVKSVWRHPVLGTEREWRSDHFRHRCHVRLHPGYCPLGGIQR